MKLVVFLPNWIGDAVMATAALRALRQGFPEAELVGMMRPGVQAVLEGTPWLDRGVLYHPRGGDPAYGSRRVIGRLRSLRPDVAVLMPNSLRTALLAWLAGARRRVGYRRYGRGWLLTDPLDPPRIGRRLMRFPMVDYYLALAYQLGCPRQSPKLELATTEQDRLLADQAARRLGIRNWDQVVVMNCSGAFGAAKLWPVEHFAQLARRIAQQLDHQVLVICGPQEQAAAEQIVRQADHPGVVTLAGGPLSLGLSKECVRRSRLMVTTDSGPRHFAVAFGVPVVGLFGPTPPIWGRNPTACEVALQVEGLPCLGCHRRRCPLGHHRCMRDLSPQRVFDAVVHLLDRTETKAA